MVVSCLLALPGASEAKPPLCTASVIEATLVGAGKLDQSAVDNGGGVNLIRCGDLTDDGATDVLFTIASGGTAGDTHFGVIEGGGVDGGGELVLYKEGYKVGVYRRDKRSFQILQPYYRSEDPNCCPSSFRQTTYTWKGSKFKAGTARKLATAPARFYKA
jgi:hypothetical protein